MSEQVLCYGETWRQTYDEDAEPWDAHCEECDARTMMSALPEPHIKDHFYEDL